MLEVFPPPKRKRKKRNKHTQVANELFFLPFCIKDLVVATTAVRKFDVKAIIQWKLWHSYYTCSYLDFLRDLEERVDQDWDGISSSLEEIRKSLLSRDGCLIKMTADGRNLKNSEKFVSKFLDMLPSNSNIGANTWRARLSRENEAIVIPTQVRITSLSNSVGFGFFSDSPTYDLALCRLIMLEKQLTSMKRNINLMVVHMSSQNTSVIHGCGTVCVSVAGAYGGFCDFDTLTQVRLYIVILLATYIFAGDLH